jgi:hypothetical protein
MEVFVVIAVVVVVLYIVFKIFKTLMKWLVIVVVVVLAIAYFSNPDFNDHSKTLTGMRKEIAREIKEKKVKFDDYKIFSLTKKKVNGEEKIVGVGAFGKVWYFDDK